LNFWNNQPHLYIGTSKGSRQFLTKRKISDDYQITRLSRNQLASAAGWVCDLGIVREANSNQRGGPLLDLGTGLLSRHNAPWRLRVVRFNQTAWLKGHAALKTKLLAVHYVCP
jgi:hypothetical protein